MKPLLRAACMAGGLALFGWFIARTGWGEISRAFRGVGWSSGLALLPFALVYLLDTLGWRHAFGPRAPAGFLTLLRVRWSGEALNSIVPSAYIGGEAIKVYLLRKRGVPTVSSAISVIAGKTCQSLAQVIFIALGAIAAWASLPAGSVAARAMFLVAALALAALAAGLWMQRRGLFGTLLSLARRIGIDTRRWSAREPAWRAFDQQLLGFYATSPRSFAGSTGAFLGGWLCDPLEILLVSHLLGSPLDYPQALAIEAFISVAKAAGAFVPGALGVQESSIVFLGAIFGLPPAFSVSYAILRRGREVLYASIGAILLYTEEASFKNLARRVEVVAHPTP